MGDRLRGLAVLLLLVAAPLACKKADPPDKAAAEPAAAAAPTPAPAAGQPDPAAADASEPKYARPGLSEDKLQRYIKSLAEGRNVFGAAAAAGNSSPAKIQAAMAEQEAFVKNYGFTGFADYMDLVGRVTLGETELMAADGAGKMRESMMKIIEDSEKSIADPKTPAETRASVTEMINETRKQLAELDAEAKHGELNAADLALVKKYRSELEAAEKANLAAQHKPKQ